MINKNIKLHFNFNLVHIRLLPISPRIHILNDKEIDQNVEEIIEKGTNADKPFAYWTMYSRRKTNLSML